MSGEQIRASIDELQQACDKISDADGCDICPLSGRDCLDYNFLEEIWSNVSAKRIQDFLDTADNIESLMDEERERLEEEERREQQEYNEWIAELNVGYFKDRGI